MDVVVPVKFYVHIHMADVHSLPTPTQIIKQPGKNASVWHWGHMKLSINNFGSFFLNRIKAWMGPPELAAAPAPPPPLDHLCGFSRAFMFIQMDHILSLSSSVLSGPWLAPDPNSKSEMEVSNSCSSLVVFIYMAVLVLFESRGIFNWGMWDLTP